MAGREELQFEVSLKSLKIAPYIGQKGGFARSVEFRVRSLDAHGTKTVESVVGEETLRRCELLTEKGPERVTVSQAWMMNRHLSDWPTDIVNLALEQAANRE